jgi:hypothetical protein
MRSWRRFCTAGRTSKLHVSDVHILGDHYWKLLVTMGVKEGKKMYVSDGYTEFWRGTLRAFPEGLANFASALSSNDVDFVTFRHFGFL